MAMAATTASAATATTTMTTTSLSRYHRSDPLDAPLIDDHLLTRMLLPRIAEAIKLAFPRAHSEWTTGVPLSSSPDNPANDDDGYSDDDAPGDRRFSSIFGKIDPSLWKMIAEGTLRAALLAGSLSRGGIVATPAMRSLGVFLRPAKNATTTTNLLGSSSTGQQQRPVPRSSRVRTCGNVAALVFATSILPTLYEELKRRRRRQLEGRERRLRLEEIRRELLAVDEQQRRPPQRQERRRPEQDVLRRRARVRKSRLRSLVADAALGAGDVVLPPLRLAKRVSYLWGLSSSSSSSRFFSYDAPDLGTAFAGWEYAADDGNGDYGDGGRRQRHANFQYGNRRLLVEEALRTVSAAIPPRRIGHGDLATGDGGVVRRGGGARPARGSGTEERRGGGGVRRGMLSRMASTVRLASRSGNDDGSQNGRGRILRRFLTLAGVAPNDPERNVAAVEEGGGPSHPRAASSPCSACGAKEPAVPYVASPCGHRYCYLCLRAAVTDDLGFRCVDCGEMVVSSRRQEYTATDGVGGR